jgi:hypothetical protein
LNAIAEVGSETGRHNQIAMPGTLPVRWRSTTADQSESLHFYVSGLLAIVGLSAA